MLILWRLPLFSASLLAGLSLEEEVAGSAIMKPRLIKQNELALAALHWEFSIRLVMKY